MRSKVQWRWGVFLVLALWFIPTGLVLAFDARAEEEVIIPAGEVVEDDLYATGDRVVVDGTINGDLVAAGREIIINGTVTGDLLGGAQSIIINGTVEDDVRVSGYALEIGPAGVIGDDLLMAGYGLVTRPGSMIRGDLLYTGFQALVGGEVGEDILVFGNGLKIEGRIAGNVEAYLGGTNQLFNPGMFIPDVPDIEIVSPGLTIGPNAFIGGRLAYQAPTAAEIPPGSVAGEITFEAVEAPADEPLFSITDFLWEFVQRFIVTSIIGLLLIWLMPMLVARPVTLIRAQPWPSLLWGLGAYFLFPLAILVAIGLVILIGLLLGWIGFGSLATAMILVTIVFLGSLLALFALLLLYVTKVVVGDLTGRAILRRIIPSLAESRVWPMILGLLIITFLVSIPYLGAVINFVVMLFGLGGVVLMRRPVTVSVSTPEESPAGEPEQKE